MYIFDAMLKAFATFALPIVICTAVTAASRLLFLTPDIRSNWKHLRL